ncbi:MAG: protein TonB [Oleiphilaceae bacterium]|jgi:protein TonB
MAINITHPNQHHSRILILALTMSLFAHFVFVLFPVKSTKDIQSSSNSRISVAMNWSQINMSETKPVKSVQELSSSKSQKKTLEKSPKKTLKKPQEKSLDNIQKLNQNLKPKKNIIDSTNTLQERKVLAGKAESDAKPNKSIVNKIERIAELPLKMLDDQVTQKANQGIVEQVLADAASQAFKEPSEESLITKQSPSAAQASLDKRIDSQISRFKIGSNANPKPNYPSLAVKRGWQGEVVLGVHVRADGSIEHLTFVKSTNYGVLNFEAYETVRTSWHFKALEDEDEQSESTYIEVPIRFNIANR